MRNSLMWSVVESTWLPSSNHWMPVCINMTSRRKRVARRRWKTTTAAALTWPLADSLRAGPLPPVFFLTAMSYWPLKFEAHKSKISLRMIFAFHQSTRTKAWEVSWFYHPTAQLPVSCQIPNVAYIKCFSCRSLYKNVSYQEPWDRPNLKNKK